MSHRDRIANRSIVFHKLGYGGFATVWLVRDETLRHGQYIALKVVSVDWSEDGLGDFTELNEYTLDAVVSAIREPQGPVSATKTASGRDWLCLHVPTLWDTTERDEFRARNLKPIDKDDTALFADLLRKMFDYDHQKRITARPLLAHSWLEATSQKPSHAEPAALSTQRSASSTQTSCQ